MGGAILIAQARGGRSPFERIVTTAPMIDIYRVRFPRAARLLAETLDIIGSGGAFIPGGGRKSIMAQPFEGNRLTSDRRRYERAAAIVAAAPSLAIGDPTIGWVNAAFRLMEKFKDAEYPRRMPVPTLVVGAGDDRIVDPRAVERFGTRLKAGRLIELPFARHEILMEQDRFRQQFWAAFDAFIPGTRCEPAAVAPTPERIVRARAGLRT
jgi:lysophospholipase